MNLFHRIYLKYKYNFLSNKFLYFGHKKYIHSQIRVRFAPSPTGHLHLGGFRTALYNYLFAKKHNGLFILRIEDTDLSRTIEGAASEIENNLHWLSVKPDESPIKGGSYGPYIQSQRSHIYDYYSKILLQNGLAYKCFCSKERLDSLSKSNKPYDNRCRYLSEHELHKLGNENVPFCIRLKMHNEIVQFDDLIFGKREIKPIEREGDNIIVKTNGLPTYHLANVIDDHLMEISHVFRGSEWLVSTPKHLYLYRCFNWDPPSFGHLPNILNPDRTKFSKRQENLHISQLRNRGYSAEAILNAIKLSGGGFENIDYEKLDSIDELVAQFQVDLISTKSGELNLSKLDDYNRLHIRKQISCNEGLKSLAHQLRNIVEQNIGSCILNTDTFFKEVLIWGQERIFTLHDFVSSNFHFLWVDPRISKSDMDAFKFDVKMVLLDLVDSLQCIKSQNFVKDEINEVLKKVQMQHNLKTSQFMKLIRITVCGLTVGPPINEVFQLLGKDIIVNRLHAALVLKKGNLS